LKKIEKNNNWKKYYTLKQAHAKFNICQLVKMEQTQLLCFQKGVTAKTIKERQNLSNQKIAELNHILNLFVNGKEFNHIDILQFNKISGLYVNFKCGDNIYNIDLKFDGKTFFEASFHTFDSDKFDSDDEEDNRLTSYRFVPFKRLYPKELPDKKLELTLDMYFDFVESCLQEVPFYVKPKKSKK
jgi:hypothetical protein